MSLQIIPKYILYEFCEYLDKDSVCNFSTCNKWLYGKINVYLKQNFYFNIAGVGKIEKTNMNLLVNHRKLIIYDLSQIENFNNLINLTHLTFGHCFNHSVKLNCLINLTHLTFMNDFDQPVDLDCLVNLTHLIFGARFNQIISVEKLVNLKYVKN